MPTGVLQNTRTLYNKQFTKV